MTCLPNWTVLYPILYVKSSSRTTHADAENESVPYPEVQEEAPDSNPDGRALEAEPDGLEVEDLRWVLVRVDLTNWEIWLIFVLKPPRQDKNWEILPEVQGRGHWIHRIFVPKASMCSTGQRLEV